MMTWKRMICGVALVAGTSAYGATLDYANAVLDDSPYAYYRFGESSGASTATDASTNGRDATYLGAPTLGVPGAGVGLGGDSAVALDAADDYLTAPSLDAFSSQLAAFSVESIFATRSTATTALFGTFNTGSNSAVRVLLNNDGSASAPGSTALFLRDEDNRLFQASITADIYDGEYHHMVITYDAAAGAAAGADLAAQRAAALTWYIDGVAQDITFGGSGTAGIPTSFSSTFDFPMTIGANNNRGTIGSFGDLTLDELAFYGSVLSESQVQSNLAASTIPEPTTLALTALGLATLATRRRARA